MKTVQISEFKAKCIGVLKQVRDTGEPVVVTLRGGPIALIEAIPEQPRGKTLGALAGLIDEHTDIVAADTTPDWEV